MYKFLIFIMICTYSFNVFCSDIDDRSTFSTIDMDFSSERFLQDSKKFKTEVYESINSLPPYEDPYHKLAELLTVFVFWGKIKDQTKIQMENAVRGQLQVLLGYESVPGQLGQEVWDRLYENDTIWNHNGKQLEHAKQAAMNEVLDKIIHETKAQVRNLAGPEARNSDWHKVWGQIARVVEFDTGKQLMGLSESFVVETKTLFISQVASQILDEMERELQNFPFAYAYQNEELRETVNLATEYLLAVYQAKTIKMMIHSSEFSKMQKRFAKQISEIVDDSDQISDIILRLEAGRVSKTKNFINTQRKLIYREGNVKNLHI